MASSIFLTSCSKFYTYIEVPTGRNIHQSFVGKNKNIVVRNYGLPNKKGSDENGGEVFAYEKETVNTSTIATSKSSQSINFYGSYNIVNKDDISGKSITSMRSNSTTIKDKIFVNFFFDRNGKVYDYKSNYGAITKTEKRLNKAKLWGTIGGSVLAVILAVSLGLAL